MKTRKHTYDVPQPAPRVPKVSAPRVRRTRSYISIPFKCSHVSIPQPTLSVHTSDPGSKYSTVSILHNADTLHVAMSQSTDIKWFNRRSVHQWNVVAAESKSELKHKLQLMFRPREDVTYDKVSYHIIRVNEK